VAAVVDTGLYRLDPSFHPARLYCQRSDGNLKHWPQSGIVIHWHDPFMIHQPTAEGSSSSPASVLHVFE